MLDLLLRETKRYIITGPPGAGKSTLIEALRQAGCPCADEVSRDIIIKEQKEGKDGMPWKNLARFTRLVFEQTIRSLQSDKNALFCDRGLPDNIAYLRQAGMEIPDYLKYFPFQAHYQRKVFYTPLWEEIYKTDPQRPDAIDMATALDLKLRRTYDEMDFELTFIPFDSPARRAAFVIRQISLFSLCLRKT